MKSLKFRIGLRIKTLFGLVVPLTLVFIVITISNERYLTREIKSSYNATVQVAIETAARHLERHTPGQFKDDPTAFLESLASSSELIDHAVVLVPDRIDPDELAVLATSEKSESLMPAVFYRRAHLEKKIFAEETGERLEMAAPFKFSDESWGIVAYGVDLEARNKLIDDLRTRSFLAIGLGMLGLSAIIFFGLEHTFLRPLEKLRRATMDAEAGEFVAPSTISHADELGDLTRAMEDATNKLKRRTSALEQRVGELTVLYNISKVTSSSLDLQRALEIIIESAIKVTDASSGFIMLADDAPDGDERKLGLRVALGVPAGKKSDDIASQEIAAFVAKNGGPLLLMGDISRLGFQHQPEFKDAMYAPINLVDETIGVIGLVNKKDGNFVKKDLQLLLTLANQASGVIHVARLFEDLQASYLSTIQALAAAIDAKDPYTRGHSSRVATYSDVIAANLSCSEAERKAIKLAAYLHDIGKIGIEEQILRKPGTLSEDEFDLIRNHPKISAKILASVTFLKETVPMVQHHHEHFNGNGYPDGLSGESIPLGARVITVADSFDAMTSDRPYRQALSFDKAFEELKRESGRHFDPVVVELFIAHVGEVLADDGLALAANAASSKAPG